MSIKPEMLRVFGIVAEKGTLAGVPQVLGRTPSSISMMSAQLEDHVGAPLFETDRKSRLTPLGQFVLKAGRRATDAFEKSTAAIRRHVVSTAGIVRIAKVPSAAMSLLAAVIQVLRISHPDIHVDVSDVGTQSVRRRVQRDEADIGILSARPGASSEGELIFCDDLGIVCVEGGAIHRVHLTYGGRSDWNLLKYEQLIASSLCLRWTTRWFRT